MKKKINLINEVAQYNFDKAQGMLEMLNDIFGTSFIFLNKRVTIKKENRFFDAYVSL